MSLEALKEAIERPGFAGRWGQSRLLENWDKWNAEHKKGGSASSHADAPTDQGWKPPAKGTPEHHDRQEIDHRATAKRHKRDAENSTGDLKLAYMQAAAAHNRAADEHASASRIHRRRDTNAQNHKNASESAENASKEANDHSEAAYRMSKGK